MIDHHGSGFDSSVVLNKLHQWRSVVKLIKNEEGIVSLKVFTGYEYQNKKLPQYVIFRCGRNHNNKI